MAVTFVPCGRSSEAWYFFFRVCFLWWMCLSWTMPWNIWKLLEYMSASFICVNTQMQSRNTSGELRWNLFVTVWDTVCLVKSPRDFELLPSLCIPSPSWDGLVRLCFTVIDCFQYIAVTICLGEHFVLLVQDDPDGEIECVATWCVCILLP